MNYRGGMSKVSWPGDQPTSIPGCVGGNIAKKSKTRQGVLVCLIHKNRTQIKHRCCLKWNEANTFALKQLQGPLPWAEANASPQVRQLTQLCFTIRGKHRDCQMIIITLWFFSVRELSEFLSLSLVFLIASQGLIKWAGIKFMKIFLRWNSFHTWNSDSDGTYSTVGSFLHLKLEWPGEWLVAWKFLFIIYPIKIQLPLSETTAFIFAKWGLRRASENVNIICTYD